MKLSEPGLPAKGLKINEGFLLPLSMPEKTPDQKLITVLRVYFVAAIVVAVAASIISTCVFHHHRYEDKPLQLVMFGCSVLIFVFIFINHRRNVKKYNAQVKDKEQT